MRTAGPQGSFSAEFAAAAGDSRVSNPRLPSARGVREPRAVLLLGSFSCRVVWTPYGWITVSVHADDECLVTF